MPKTLSLDEMVTAAMDDLVATANGAYEYIVGPALGLKEGHVLVRRFVVRFDKDGEPDRLPCGYWIVKCVNRTHVLEWARAEWLRLLAGHGALLGTANASLGTPIGVRPAEA